MRMNGISMFYKINDARTPQWRVLIRIKLPVYGFTSQILSWEN